MQNTQELTPQAKSHTKKLIAAVAIAILIVSAITVGIIVLSRNGTANNPEMNTDLSNDQTVDTNNQNTNTHKASVKWSYDNNEWVATGEVPTCPEPLLISPADSNLATGILYPGQFRGPYKAHGGFNFNGDNTTTKIDVKLAIDSQLITVSRYIQTGEVQYLLDFLSPCGIRVRYDHLYTLTPEFQAIMDQLPPAKVNDSTTTDIIGGKSYPAGEIIATEIGFPATNPPASVFDFGVYDYRQPNEASKDPAYIGAHQSSGATDFYAICWLDYLPQADQALLKLLPVVSGESGSYSDYCK